METEGQSKGIRGWVDVDAIRHLAKHISSNIAALLPLALFDWLLHFLGKAEILSASEAGILEFIDFWTMVVVFVFFGLKTIALVKSKEFCRFRFLGVVGSCSCWLKGGGLRRA